MMPGISTALAGTPAGGPIAADTAPITVVASPVASGADQSSWAMPNIFTPAPTSAAAIAHGTRRGPPPMNTALPRAPMPLVTRVSQTGSVASVVLRASLSRPRSRNAMVRMPPASAAKKRRRLTERAAAMDRKPSIASSVSETTVRIGRIRMTFAATTLAPSRPLSTPKSTSAMAPAMRSAVCAAVT